MAERFKIKICGITNPVDAAIAVDAGADAIGLNFYRGSKRHVSTAAAREIVDVAQLHAASIGVFVNHAANVIRETCDATGITWIQLHGDEPPEFLREIDQDFRVVRARRIDEGGMAAIVEDLQACSDLSGRRPEAVLIDAATPGQFGGSGHTVDWTQLSDHRARLGLKLVLAGGLTPDNVAEAIRIARPHAVDVASGVESSPGKKDRAKVRDFVAAANAAFAEC